MCEWLPLRFFAQRKRHLGIKIKDSTISVWAHLWNCQSIMSIDFFYDLQDFLGKVVCDTQYSCSKITMTEIQISCQNWKAFSQILAIRRWFN